MRTITRGGKTYVGLGRNVQLNNRTIQSLYIGRNYVYKKCNQCLVILNEELFKKHSQNSLNRDSTCKKCRKTLTQLYEKTEKGFIMRLYRNMKSRITGVQKKKYHLYEGKELLSKEDFYNFADCEEFKVLFESYKRSNYDRKLAPSPDRVDPDIGYIISNLEWVTMGENSRRSSETRKRLL